MLMSLGMPYSHTHGVHLPKSSPTYDKIRFCARQAQRDGLMYFWVDACCIDQRNSAEVSEAINSMFSWYKGAARCYVYMSCVPPPRPCQDTGMSSPSWEPDFSVSRWFRRGWTLQELLASASVHFFAADGTLLGDKASLSQEIHEITSIPVSALHGEPLNSYGVDERFKWASGRETSREEDWAYSLLGIFGVFIPPIYGEGRSSAVRRLREAINKDERQNLLDDVAMLAQVSATVPLDMSLDEVQSLFDKVKEQTEIYESKLDDSKDKSKDAVAPISDNTLRFIFALLILSLPSVGIAVTLGIKIMRTSAMERVIVSGKEKVLKLRFEDKQARKTLSYLKAALKSIRGQRSDTLEDNDAQHVVAEKQDQEALKGGKVKSEDRIQDRKTIRPARSII